MDETWPDRGGRSRGKATVPAGSTAASVTMGSRAAERVAPSKAAAERPRGSTPSIADKSAGGLSAIRFSVDIPVWNEARWLPGTIESVLAPSRLAAAILAVTGPVGSIHRIMARAHRAGRVII